mmetsp:Transcript_495/g.816  ORF Transcript_495/g.816 Transcript_495/m.816 type:complete len:251 (-) Transcript_495:113-865(-)|eukprot:CAMPEP_0119015300 /NCGR_PEP_ID=MMETSP1176-20130426/10770_1 /TAXON_ID=265551 /ORGANISM="Synedropsis recta cf, Strain CCMP1620" /LENGTH=250 /DNA_ID=CAMNT_0006968579 /DNA_START=100 /DNA_END=852 /DNA_ORIENTATION=-
MKIAIFLLVLLLNVSSSAGKGDKKADEKTEEKPSICGRGNQKSNRRRRRSLRKDKTAEEDSEGGFEDFESGFFIAYTGPEKRFNVADIPAIEFLQSSIRDVYNEEIGCENELFVDDVILFNQTMTTLKTGRQLQSPFGLTFSLVNYYKIKGYCFNCGEAPTLANDAFRRNLARVFRRRRLDESEESGVDRFNGEIVLTLTTQEEFRVVETASLSDDQPEGLDVSEDYLDNLLDIMDLTNESTDVVSNDEP